MSLPLPRVLDPPPIAGSAHSPRCRYGMRRENESMMHLSASIVGPWPKGFDGTVTAR